MANLNLRIALLSRVAPGVSTLGETGTSQSNDTASEVTDLLGEIDLSETKRRIQNCIDG